MSTKDIIIRGAREHNLKDITVKLPRDKLIVITGLSGSGKSSLAFDTLYAEGQRRYVESLSSYARQFLGLMNKPDVDAIEGLSPAISIEQKTTSKNPRSTVGTVTEIYDYLRLLWARVGVPHDPETGEPLVKQTPEQITNRILDDFSGKQVTILTPIIRQKKGTYQRLIEELGEEGYSRVRVDGTVQRTDEPVDLERYVKHDIEAVQDRLTVKKEEKARLAEAVEQAIKRSGGLLYVLEEEQQTTYTTSNASSTGFSLGELEPRMFSFNSPFGACQECDGLGVLLQFSEELLMPDKSLALAEGAIQPWSGARGTWRLRSLKRANRSINLLEPFEELSKKQQDYVLYGGKGFEGAIPTLERIHQTTDSDKVRNWLTDFMIERPCPSCEGHRLKEEVLCVLLEGKNIIEFTDLSIEDAYDWMKQLRIAGSDSVIAKPILKELRGRLKFLRDVGLSYLTLSRSAGTLSGGEAQRIRLATQIGSKLMGVMYILDEPSIGLHQRDNQKLIDTLKELRDLGNTVIVVEHDEDTIRQADHVLDLGPGAGRHGGEVTAQGTPKQIEKGKSLTGHYLAGKKSIPIPDERRKPYDWIELTGASQNNLQMIDVKFPTRVLCCVAGVSGSGKSTLVNQTLQQALRKELIGTKIIAGKHDTLEVPDHLRKVIIIDQSPIGRTPRSNPATYTKVFDHIRKLFASTKEAKRRGYKPGRFSFNVKGGRCEHCSGDGTIKIEMNFLPDVYVECEECHGKRYNEETLSVTYKEKNIADVLDMTIEEANEFFAKVPHIQRRLQTLVDVGLDYLKLGQSSVTLSGGEAQRIKLTRELSKRSSGETIYILDEPTTGLHFEDVNKLLGVLQRLVKQEHTVLVIEHNLDVLKTADWIIDLGPEGGSGGGRVVAQGTPEEVAQVKGSHTGSYLKKMLS